MLVELGLGIQHCSASGDRNTLLAMPRAGRDPAGTRSQAHISAFGCVHPKACCCFCVPKIDMGQRPLVQESLAHEEHCSVGSVQGELRLPKRMQFQVTSVYQFRQFARRAFSFFVSFTLRFGRMCPISTWASGCSIPCCLQAWEQGCPLPRSTLQLSSAQHGVSADDSYPSGRKRQGGKETLANDPLGIPHFCCGTEPNGHDIGRGCPVPHSIGQSRYDAVRPTMECCAHLRVTPVLAWSSPGRACQHRAEIAGFTFPGLRS